MASAAGQPLARLPRAFLEIHDGVHRGLFPPLALTRQPINLDTIHRGVRPQTEMHSGIVGGQVTPIASNPAPNRPAIPAHQFHHAPIGRTIGFRAVQMNQQRMTAVWHSVQQQTRGAIIIRPQDVHSAVIVYVAEHRGPAAGCLNRRSASRLFRHLRKATPAADPN